MVTVESSSEIYCVDCCIGKKFCEAVRYIVLSDVLGAVSCVLQW